MCICVDDFGLSNGVNTAVFTLAARRRVQATSCMVFAPAWTSGAPDLKQLRAQHPTPLDVGLHLDLTQYPSRPAMRHRLQALILKSCFGRLDPAAIRLEVKTQLDAFEQAMGRAPDFVDGHQHVHQLPVIRDALIEEMQQRYGTAMPWVRVSRGPSFWLESRASGWRVALKAGVIKLLGARGLARLARHAGAASNQRLLGIHDFQAHDTVHRQRLDAWLAMVIDADLFMCHPSTKASSDDAIGQAREMEFEMLNGHALPAMLAAHGVQLLPMSQILGHSR